MWLVASILGSEILNRDCLPENWAINYYPGHKSPSHLRLTNSFTVLETPSRYPRKVNSLGVKKHTVGAYSMLITLELSSSLLPQSTWSINWGPLPSRPWFFFFSLVATKVKLLQQICTQSSPGFSYFCVSSQLLQLPTFVPDSSGPSTLGDQDFPTLQWSNLETDLLKEVSYMDTPNSMPHIGPSAFLRSPLTDWSLWRQSGREHLLPATAGASCRTRSC